MSINIHCINIYKTKIACGSWKNTNACISSTTVSFVPQRSSWYLFFFHFKSVEQTLVRPPLNCERKPISTVYTWFTRENRPFKIRCLELYQSRPKGGGGEVFPGTRPHALPCLYTITPTQKRKIHNNCFPLLTLKTGHVGRRIIL